MFVGANWARLNHIPSTHFSLKFQPMFTFTFWFYHVDKSLWPDIRFESYPGESMAWATSWHGPKAHHSLLCKWAELTYVVYVTVVRISCVSSGAISEMVWRLQAARHVGFMGHLSLDHPMTEWLHHAVIEVSSVHWWECAELSQGVRQALPCCLRQVLRGLCKACFRCLASQIQQNVPAL